MPLTPAPVSDYRRVLPATHRDANFPPANPKNVQAACIRAFSHTSSYGCLIRFHGKPKNLSDVRLSASFGNFNFDLTLD